MNIQTTEEPPPQNNDDEQWKARFRAAAAGGWPGRHTWKGHTDPDEILRPLQVAKIIGTGVDAVYLYKRYGNIPVPDLQEGGRKPLPGELIHWRGKKIRRTLASGEVVLYPVETSRKPKPGELIAPHRVGWCAWRIFRWITAERKGRGWHDKGADRVRVADRSRRVGPGERVPPTGPEAKRRLR